MENEKKKEEQWSIETTRRVQEAKAAAAKGKSITFKSYTEDIKTRLAKVEEKRIKIKKLGSEKLLAKQRERGKLTARERMDLLFDNQAYTEHGIFAESQVKEMGMDKYYTPAEGVVCGFGYVNGRPVCAYATDYTVLAGSSGEGHMVKIADITKLAAAAKVPVIGIIDSAGVRLREAAQSQRAYFETFWLQSIYSGVIPQITIICGACAAGQAYSPLLTDFLIMTKTTGTNMWLGGPRATAATTFEDITAIGGADYHMKYSGSCHYVAEDDNDAIEAAKRLLSYWPSNYEEQPPYVPTKDAPNRKEDKILDLLPEDPRKPYNMRKIINMIVDDGEFFEIQKGYAKSAIIGFCRFDGHAFGLYAANPMHLGGCLEPDSCDKLSRFFTFCDAFNIPLVYLVDTPAITVGDEWEKRGVIRHATKLLHTTNTATVPRIAILIRKGYGGTLPIFLARPMAADFVYVWPTGEYAPMGPDGAVAIAYDREIRELPTDEERVAFSDAKKKEYFDNYVDPLQTATNMRYDFFDDIIDPRQTREVIINAYKLGKTIKERLSPLPKKKHANRPV